MAETIGVVAAILEFAKVALEVKQFCSSLRNAPESLRHLSEELEALEDVLQTLKDQETALSTFAPPDVVQKCRKQTEKAINGLKPVCEELLKCIKRSRLRGSVKALLKEDALEKATQAVERVKTNLILAQMSSLNAMNMLNMRQHAETQTLILSSSTGVTAIVQDLQQMPQSVSLAIPAGPDGSALVHKDSRRVSNSLLSDSRGQQLTGIRTSRLMLLQSRLLGKAIEFVQLRACGAWTYGFRTYNIRPGYPPVFQHVEESNVVALQKLLQAGQASVLDRNPEGLTLLHMACMQADAAMIRFLVQQGVDPNDRDNTYNFSCLKLICHKGDREDTFEAIQALQEGADLDGLTVPRQIESSISSFTYLGNSNDIQDLIGMISPPWSTWDLSHRLRAAYYACGAQRPSRTFWRCLSQSQLHSNCLVRKRSADAEHPTYTSLVWWLAEVLAAHWENYIDERPDYDGWRAVFRAAVSLGGLRAGFDHDCESPMLAYLGFSGFDQQFYCRSRSDLNSKRLTYKVRHWAREIINAGQQLDEYGRWEHEQIYSKDKPFSTCSKGNEDCAECATVRVIKFTYGADPDDWNISVSLSSDEYVGEFFERMESQDRAIDLPGAWPKEPSPHDRSDTHVSRVELVNRWDLVCSKRRRQRSARYFGLTEDELKSAYDRSSTYDWPAWNAERWKKRRAKRAQFFKEAGISPPHRSRC